MTISFYNFFYFQNMYMKQTYFLLPVIILSFFLSACGDNSSSKATSDTGNTADTKKTMAVPVAFTWDQLEKADGKEITDNYVKTLERKVIIIEGYLALTSSVYTRGKSIRCNLYPRFNQAKGMHANLELTAGTGKNEMEPLPKKYKTEDFKIKTDVGEIVGEGNYVRVTGELSDRYDDKATVYVQKIEKATAPADDHSTALELTPANIASADHKLVYISGILEIPSLMGLISYYYPLKIKGTSFPTDLFLNANVRIGNGNSQMEPLPENFTEKDINIHDHNGNLLPAGKKVKIIGVYEKNYGSDGGSIFVEAIMDEN